MDQTELDTVLDVASDLLVNDGYESVTLQRVAHDAGIPLERIESSFGTTEELLVGALNREFGLMFRVILDNVERDPRGGLVSHICRYTLAAIYERPVARALYLIDRSGLNELMRSTHGFSYVPRLGIRAEFLERMKEVGMVRADVDAAQVSAVLSAVSAGVALTSPHSQVDEVSGGLFTLLSRAVDADVEDTSAGKRVFIDYATSLASRLRDG